MHAYDTSMFSGLTEHLRKMMDLTRRCGQPRASAFIPVTHAGIRERKQGAHLYHSSLHAVTVRSSSLPMGGLQNVHPA